METIVVSVLGNVLPLLDIVDNMSYACDVFIAEAYKKLLTTLLCPWHSVNLSYYMATIPNFLDHTKTNF